MLAEQTIRMENSYSSSDLTFPPMKEENQSSILPIGKKNIKKKKKFFLNIDIKKYNKKLLNNMIYICKFIIY